MVTLGLVSKRSFNDQTSLRVLELITLKNVIFYCTANRILFEDYRQSLFIFTTFLCNVKSQQAVRKGTNILWPNNSNLMVKKCSLKPTLRQQTMRQN